MVSLTRYRDLANNSDKWRRIFTVHDLKGIFRPYTFTQTGRWTHLTAAGNWSGGTVREGKVVSNASWNRAGKSHVRLHQNEVARQRKDYSVTEADRVLQWAEARDMLLRLPVNKIIPASGTATSVQARPVRPLLVEANAGMKVPADSHLGNRIAQFLTQVMDQDNDPFDLFADMAMLKQEFAEEEKRVEKMSMDLKLANETLLQRAVE
jgi:hypothetical protein